ncbi:MAG: hypothetical protein U0P30_10085 [Vicinamibacterales bacterium]
MSRALVVLAFAVLTVVMAAPWSLHPASRVVTDNPDTHLFLWTVGWNTHALLAQPLHIFDANIFAPMPNTLAYSENAIGSLPFAAPVIWATGDLVLALNVVLLSACALCGVGAYVLGRRLGMAAPAAFVCGVVFAFAPTRFYRMSQLHQNTVQWIPFTLAFLHTYLEGGRARDLRIALALFTLQALTSGHGAVFLVVAIAVLATYHLLRGTPVALIRRLRDVGVTGALLLVPAALLLLPYRRARADVGLDRTFDAWNIAPESFIASPTHVHQWLLSLVTDRPVNDLANAFLFPGYLAVILAIVALWPANLRRADDAETTRRRHAWGYALLAFVSVLFFVGGPLAIWPWVRAWPGFSFIRVSSRFITLTTLALAVLAGFGTERLLRGRSPRVALGATTTLILLLLGEYSTHPFTGNPFTMPRPAIVAWLAAQPGDKRVAEVPVPRAANAGAYERFETAAMLHSTVGWWPTIHGYSGTRPERHDQVYRAMNTFPDAASLDALRSLGVTHVIAHRPLYPPERWSELQARAHEATGLRLVHEEADGAVFSLIGGDVQ